MKLDHSKEADEAERGAMPTDRFLVFAPSVNAVRRALYRAPGGVKVVGRHDRETILCTHTMDEHSLSRHWPVIVSRLEKEGLRVVDRPGLPNKTETEPAEDDGLW
jgi:hypothetical protein